MASPPIPPNLIQLAARPFSFYPAIAGAEPNQWRLRKADWQELVVCNTRSEVEVSIPRRYVGEISEVGDPVLIVGLLRELQFLEGEVRPKQRRVIEMPVAVGERIAGPTLAPKRQAPAPVVGIRLEQRRDHKFYKIAGGSLIASVFLLLAITNLVHIDEGWRITPAWRSTHLALATGDDYVTVVHKMGKPMEERVAVQGGREYRALVYRRFTAILSPGYLGSVDANWKPLAGGEALRGVQRF